MKKILLFFLINITLCTALKIRLSDNKTLDEKFSKAGFQHFNKITKIVDELADKELEILSIIMIVEMAVFEYQKYNEDNTRMIALLKENKKYIYELLFENNYEALQELNKLRCETS